MKQRRINGLLRIEDLLGMALMLFLIGFCCFQFADEPPTRAVNYASFVRSEPIAAEPFDERAPVEEPTAVGFIRDRATRVQDALLEPIRECSQERQAELERILERCRS